jgi:uncharacterized protein (DUF2267 family)
MSISTVKAFDSTIHKTNTWLKELMTELAWEDYARSYHALRAVLHTLRDRLTVEEATDLAAQLPMLIRGFYYEGWNPSRKPVSGRKKDEFLAQVLGEFGNDPHVDIEEVTRAVFRVISNHVSSGEIDDIKRCLPQDLTSLWP